MKTIVKARIDLANNLGLSVCPERVETTSELQFLREKECDVAQGDLLGRPSPVEDF